MPTHYDRARLILGLDLLTPQEVMTACGTVYTADQLQLLADTLPTVEELQLLKQDGYLLVPDCYDPTMRWLKVPKTIYWPGSLNKNWDEQVTLVSVNHYVLNTPDVVWILKAYRAVRGIWLLSEHYVRTSSVRPNGHLAPGLFHEHGADINGCPDDIRTSHLGIAIARV